MNKRVCSQCNKLMSEGYVVDNGARYYCSDKCLHKNISKIEWNQLDRLYNYWTIFENYNKRKKLWEKLKRKKK